MFLSGQTHPWQVIEKENPTLTGYVLGCAIVSDTMGLDPKILSLG
jgi:hypothetical protein